MVEKVNKSKIRREVSALIADAFIQTGKEYTCVACIFDMRPMALTEAKKLLDQGINLSKSHYPFAYAGLMADMFLSDAANIVENYYFPKDNDSYPREKNR